MLMQILWECGDMRILKNLFVIGVLLYLWKHFQLSSIVVIKATDRYFSLYYTS